MKTARRCSNDLIALLKEEILRVRNLRRCNTSNLEEMKKFTRLEDAITRSIDDIRRATLEDTVRR